MGTAWVKGHSPLNSHVRGGSPPRAILGCSRSGERRPRRPRRGVTAGRCRAAVRVRKEEPDWDYWPVDPVDGDGSNMIFVLGVGTPTSRPGSGLDEASGRQRRSPVPDGLLAFADETAPLRVITEPEQ